MKDIFALGLSAATASPDPAFEIHHKAFARFRETIF
jgi:hypothetical protein